MQKKMNLYNILNINFQSFTCLNQDEKHFKSIMRHKKKSSLLKTLKKKTSNQILNNNKT